MLAANAINIPSKAEAQSQGLSDSVVLPPCSGSSPVAAALDDTRCCTPQTPTPTPHMNKETPVESTGKQKNAASNFCHYTIDNVLEETKKVAPSGSFKTKERRKKEQEQRRRRKQDTRRVLEIVERNFKCLDHTFATLKERIEMEEQTDEVY